MTQALGVLGEPVAECVAPGVRQVARLTRRCAGNAPESSCSLFNPQERTGSFSEAKEDLLVPGNLN